MDHHPKPPKGAPETEGGSSPRRLEEWLSAAMKLPLDERESFLINLRQVMPEAARDLESGLGRAEAEETLPNQVRTDVNEGNRFPTVTCTGLSQTYSFNRAAAESTDATLINPALKEVDSPFNLTSADRIGPYSIIKPLGRGGMGKVFLARQDTPTRKVALKLIARDEVSQEFISRFETEYQTMAMMNHANIAHIFDAGTTNTGHIYLAMEAIKGRPITQYCKEEALPLNERLYLFIQLCNGIHHAHQKTVIHRDLKPSNILVTTKDKKPVVKIIDFGLAKGTDQHFCRQPFHTKQGAFLGTPAYMSPEQLAGWSEQIDIRSDVYALGILLYELLTGIHPFDLSCFTKLPLDRALNKLRTEMPSKPSWRIKHLPERERQVKIRKELDWVVLKALAKDPKERYASVAALKEDVVRFLSHQPVRAARTSFLYHFRLFIRRNKAWVSAAALTLFALILAVAIGVQFSLSVRNVKAEAQQSSHELSAANAFLQEMAFGEDPHLPDRKKTAIERLQLAEDRLPAASGGNSSLEASLLTILGNAYLKLDHPQPALRHLHRALQLRQHRFGEQGAPTLRSHYFLARAFLAEQSSMEAAHHFEKAASGQTAAIGRYHRHSLQSQTGLAEAQMSMGRWEEAQTRLETVLTDQRKILGRSDEDTIRTLSLLADCLLARELPIEAENLYRSALRNLARAGLNYPGFTDIEVGLAKSLIQQKRPSEAEPLLRKALAEYRRNRGELHERTLALTATLARCLDTLNRFQEAELRYSELFQKHWERSGETHPETLRAAIALADIRSRDGQSDRAIDLLVLLSDACEHEKLSHEDALDLYQDLGEYLLDAGRYSEAVGIFERKLELGLARHGEAHRNTVAAWAGMAMAYERLGIHDEAAFLYCRALEVSRDQLRNEALADALDKLEGGSEPNDERDGRDRQLFALLRGGPR